MKRLSQIGVRGALLVGAVAGMVLGWVLGSWTTCSAGPGCDFRLDAVNTLVALVGGVGTFITLLIGLAAFNQQNRDKARATALDSRRSAVRLKPLGRSGNSYSKIQIQVTNQTTKDMTNVSFVLDHEEESVHVLKEEDQIHSGRTFGTSVSAVEFLSVSLEGDENEVRQIINSHFADRVSFLFEIDGEGFVRKNDIVRTR